MARITMDDLNRIDKNRNSIHSTVKATYTVFTNGGKQYFQIDTYGTSARKFNDSVSQSIQIDRDTAVALIDILKNAFDIK